MSQEHEPSPVEVPPEGAQEREQSGLPPIVKVGIVFTMLGGALALLLFGSSASDAFVYSKLVEEVTQKPAEFKGRELRVEGDLKQGSLKFAEDPCEYRFTIGKPGHELPVRFPECIVPDTFKDGVVGLKVTVQGKLTDNGYFLANEVIPKCPSKYEMNERAKTGEAVPHAIPQRMPLEG